MVEDDSNWFVCPICGADVKASAVACPQCGSDDETGWSDNTMYDEVDLPTDAEQDAKQAKAAASSGWVGMLIVCVVIGMIVFLIIRGIW